MPTFGSLFSGIDGLGFGLELAGWECRWQVEVDEWRRGVLERHWPSVARYADVRQVDGQELEPVFLVAGGFPCQPFSQAGRRLGIQDERWLWPHFGRLVRRLRPHLVLVENTSGIAASWGALGRILCDLHELGFDAEWSPLSACSVGAPHTRERLFLLAYPQGSDEQGESSRWADALHDWRTEPRGGGGSPGGDGWISEPALDRVAHGVPRRVVRPALSALGDAVVPQVAEWIGRRLMEAT